MMRINDPYTPIPHVSESPFAMCGFEDDPVPAQCDFTVGGAGVWQVGTGPTETLNTGPDVDQTLATDAGKNTYLSECRNS